MTYAIAKLAVKIFESEYIGQNQDKLWEWAVEKANVDCHVAKTTK